MARALWNIMYSEVTCVIFVLNFSARPEDREIWRRVVTGPLSVQFSSVQFSRSVVSDSLRPHEPQRARPPCPSPTPGVHSNSRASSWWCHSVVSSCRHLLLLPLVPFNILSKPSLLVCLHDENGTHESHCGAFLLTVFLLLSNCPWSLLGIPVIPEQLMCSMEGTHNLCQTGYSLQWLIQRKSCAINQSNPSTSGYF